MKARTFLELLQDSFGKAAKVLHTKPKEPVKLGSHAIISGDYDDGEITLYLVCNDLDMELSTSQLKELEYEAEKTYAHECVHMEQDFADDLKTVHKDTTHVDYMLSRSETEAYARVDIPNDIRHYGLSADLWEYTYILVGKGLIDTEKGKDAYNMLKYFDTPIDEYIEDYNNGKLKYN